MRLYEEAYDFISDIAEKKKLSRSFVTESIVRTAIARNSISGDVRDTIAIQERHVSANRELRLSKCRISP